MNKNSALGAVIGDIVGSKYEFNNLKSKVFPLFTEDNYFTDDTVMTLALMDALVAFKGDKSKLGDLVIDRMRLFGNKYPDAGYGGRFYEWIFDTDMGPYGSYGNGSAMRVSGVAYVGKDLEEVKEISRIVTEVTHNHKEGIKGAEATAVATYLALCGESKNSIRKYIEDNYYKLDFSIDEIRPSYKFNETCQGTVPQAIEAFLESKDFDDAIRLAVSVGGDSDTLAAITGAIAGAYYAVPDEVAEIALEYLTDDLQGVYDAFNDKYISL